ncbi:hypothetical protein PG993_003237 [Apiospora rasikravindrae]|uniref:Cell wall protein n=1 Tax=Apiospora rasikravindrae TaxID=990691 RepID=A0ABR1TZ02_9PEZI
MKLASFFLKATLAGVAYAQLETIQQAIGAVSDALGDLDTKVKAISGTDANSAAPVLQASQKILTTMQSSTTKVNGAEALGVFDALSLQDTANSLVTSVNTTMKDLVAKKPQMDMLGVTMVAVKSIQDQKTASKGLGDAIVSKVPGVGQGIAQGSIDQINAALDGGIKALSAGGAGAGAGTGAGTAGAGAGVGAGAANGGSMGGGMGAGSGRNSSSSRGSGSSSGTGSGRNSTSANGTGNNSPALNPAQPADAMDRPSTNSAQLPGMMTSSGMMMPMPTSEGMMMPMPTSEMMTMSVPAVPDMMSSATTAMIPTTMMTGEPQTTSVMAESGAASLGGRSAALIAGGFAVVVAIGLL